MDYRLPAHLYTYFFHNKTTNDYLAVIVIKMPTAESLECSLHTPMPSHTLNRHDVVTITLVTETGTYTNPFNYTFSYKNFNYKYNEKNAQRDANTACWL